MTESAASPAPRRIGLRLQSLDVLRRDRLIIGLVYTAAWWALLVNRGVYWDDWTFVGVAPESLVRTYRELGMPWLGVLHAAMMSTPSPGLVGHVLVFVAYLSATLILYTILCRSPGLSRMDGLVAALTFAVLPVNYARIALIDIPYGLSLLAFLAATWLLMTYLQEGGRMRRFGALALFLVSFTTASLLILYAVPMVLAAVIIWRSDDERPWVTIARHADFIALPGVYWLLKSALLTPTGAYEGYNAVTLTGLATMPEALLPIPGQVLVEPIVRAVTVAGLLGIVVGGVVAMWLLGRARVEESGSFVSAPWLAVSGVVVLGLGVAGYLAVGRIPTIWDWSSRHQLLVPLGVGLLAAAAARGLAHPALVARGFGMTVGLLIGISAVADTRTLIAYQADWFKQVALMDVARTVPEIEAARHIRVIDEATDLNALRRTYRFYEYNSMFSQVLGDTRRLFVDPGREPSPDDLATYIARPGYHMGQYLPTPIDLDLRISSSRGVPADLDILRLVALEAIDSSSFHAELSDLIEVDASPAGPGS